MNLKQLLLLAGLFIAVPAMAQTPAPIKLVNIILTPDHDDWNYALNEIATIKIQVIRYGVPVKGAVVSCEYGPEMLRPEKKEMLPLANGEGNISIGTSREPGFRQLNVSITVDGTVYSDLVKVAFAPGQIKPTVPLPRDFNAFWDRAKQAAAQVPMDAQLTYLPAQSNQLTDVYLVNLQNYKAGQRLYGYLCKPKAPGKYPVLFEPPGAGIKAIAPNLSLAAQGFIVLSIEIHGLSPLMDAEAYRNVSTAFGDYMFNKLDDKDNYYYKSVYLGCVRSIDFLCSLPEYDGKNVIVDGGSQGGALSIVTAALDKRVKALVVFYPALCDLTGYLHGRAGGWPHLLNEQNQKTTNTPDKLNTISYYDVVNFAKQLAVPGFYSWGYNDTTVPPTSVFAAVNAITAPKTVAITQIAGHWRFGETNQQSVNWIKTRLGKP